MEAGEDAAGDGDEEHRQEVAIRKVLRVVDSAVSPCAVPQLNERVALGEDADEHADCREEQYAAEHRVNAADYRVDGEHGCNEVVDENDAVDDPSGNRGGLAGEAEHLLCGDVARGVDEHRADEQQQYAHEHVVYPVNTLVGILFDHVRHLAAAVAQTDHAGEVIMHRAADDVADGDCDECDGAEENTLNGAEDRACARDVEQVYKAVLPALHRHVVHAVLLCVRRCLAVVRTEHLFTQLAVQICADNKHRKANYECYQNYSSLTNFFQ